MAAILDEIVASKRGEIDRAKTRVAEQDLERTVSAAPGVRDFRAALVKQGMQVIAEVKKASPSAGVLRQDFDPVLIARTYAEHGAAAISVLTDEPFFQGKLEYLTAIRGAVGIPVLRKDFILERYQVLEARVAGADAVLLIGEILSAAVLGRLLREIEGLGMAALVEIHDAENLAKVLDAGATIIGINNRNLRTFETRLEHTFELRERVPRDRCVVSESGIRIHQDLQRLAEIGVDAVLVGEALMRCPDIGKGLDELRGVARL